jgi:hypothetical protein
MITELHGVLKKGEVSVKFTKKDGTERTMRCTTNTDRIPVELHPKNDQKKVNESVQTAFDLDINEWRSFRWDSVIWYSTEDRTIIANIVNETSEEE